MNTGMYNETYCNERNMSGDEQRDVPRIVRFGIFEANLAAGELRREGTLVAVLGSRLVPGLGNLPPLSKNPNGLGSADARIEEGNNR